MAPTTPLAAAVAGLGLLLAALASWGLVREVPQFWDPCQEWGIGGSDGSGSGSYTARPTDECPGVTGTSETKSGAALRLAAVFGVTIVAGALAVAAGWRKGWGLALAASVLMAAETVLLFWGLSIAFVLAALASVLFLVAALRWRRRPAATVSQPL